MRVLLDTHALLWFIDNAPELSSTARELIENEDSDILLSTASLWEMAIKFTIGKLQLPDTRRTFAEQLIEQLSLNSISILPINPAHLFHTVSLPLHHRDPFDRLIVAQCLHEGIPIISVDSVLDSYGVTRWW